MSITVSITAEIEIDPEELRDQSIEEYISCLNLDDFCVDFDIHS